MADAHQNRRMKLSDLHLDEIKIEIPKTFCFEEVLGI
jgi:hypothetical protein